MEIRCGARVCYGPVRAAAAGMLQYQRRADVQAWRSLAGERRGECQKIFPALYVELPRLHICRLLPGRGPVISKGAGPPAAAR